MRRVHAIRWRGFDPHTQNGALFLVAMLQLYWVQVDNQKKLITYNKETFNFRQNDNYSFN